GGRPGPAAGRGGGSGQAVAGRVGRTGARPAGVLAAAAGTGSRGARRGNGGNAEALRGRPAARQTGRLAAPARADRPGRCPGLARTLPQPPARRGRPGLRRTPERGEPVTPPRDPLAVPLAWPTFAYPMVLLLLAVPVLLLAFVWARRWLLPTRRVVLPLDRAVGRSGWWWWPFITLAGPLPPLLLAVVVLILAGPQRTGSPQQKRSLTNIEFCVDVSGSMMSTYGEGTRYDAAMKAVDQFLDYRKGDAFGLTFFG